MSSERTSSGFEFCCDNCGEVRAPGKLGLGSSKRDFGEEWSDAKEDGWRAVKKKDAWEHLCPNC
jgi:hypothetical protein